MEKMNPVNWFSSAPKVKPAELEAISSSATMATLWQASVGSAGGYVLTPAVVGSSVYAAAQDGTLARFDNGGQAWRINAGQPISGGVGADGRLVVVDAKVADKSVPPGTVLPDLVHGGPGRAGGGEELGGLRGMRLYQQRTAVQGNGPLIAKIVGAA